MTGDRVAGRSAGERPGVSRNSVWQQALIFLTMEGLGWGKRWGGAQCGEGSHALDSAIGAGVAPGAGDGAGEEVAAAVEQAQRAQVRPAGGQRPRQGVVAQRQILHQRRGAPPSWQRACAHNTTIPVRLHPRACFLGRFWHTRFRGSKPRSPLKVRGNASSMQSMRLHAQAGVCCRMLAVASPR